MWVYLQSTLMALKDGRIFTLVQFLMKFLIVNSLYWPADKIHFSRPIFNQSHVIVRFAILKYSQINLESHVEKLNFYIEIVPLLQR